MASNIKHKEPKINFQDAVKEHLSAYKLNVLSIAEDGIYKHSSGKEKSYKHILPFCKSEYNIIESYRKEFWGSNYGDQMKKSKHHLFNHLNSSQAMCINFFYPLIEEKALDIILNILGIPSIVKYGIDNVCFEKKSELEVDLSSKPYRVTNFDFFMKLSSGTKLYFEIKYTETEFGRAVHDKNHINKYNDIYSKLLAKKQAIKEEYKEVNKFLDNYQIMRNLTHIDNESYVIFIYPDDNTKIKNSALVAQNEIIEKSWKSHFIPLAWEELVGNVINQTSNTKLKNYYSNDFTEKYMKY